MGILMTYRPYFLSLRYPASGLYAVKEPDMKKPEINIRIFVRPDVKLRLGPVFILAVSDAFHDTAYRRIIFYCHPWRIVRLSRITALRPQIMLHAPARFAGTIGKVMAIPGAEFR